MDKFTLTRQECQGEVVKSGYRIWNLGLIFKLINIYFETFADSYKTCAQIQTCYTPFKLLLACLDKDYFKCVVFFDGEPIGFCLLTNNLEKASVTYMNPTYFKYHYPEYTANGRLQYVTAICVLPDMQKDGYGVELLRSVCEFIYDTKSTVLYDYSVTKNKWLTDVIRGVGTEFAPNTEILQDSQSFTHLYYDENGQPC